MAGSSGFHFVRAAYQQGMISRRRLAGDTLDAVKFRLWGSTDAGTAKVRARLGSYLEGVQERDLRRMAPTLIRMPGGRSTSARRRRRTWRGCCPTS
jgi:hypothetical protein